MPLGVGGSGGKGESLLGAQRGETREVTLKVTNGRPADGAGAWKRAPALKLGSAQEAFPCLWVLAFT